jgi:cytochrome c
MKGALYPFLIMAALVLPAAGIAAGDPAKGRIVFARCMACHKVDASGANDLGPNLYGVVGRPVASVKGYIYSTALQKKKGKWMPKELNAYLAAPAIAVPGNKMMFAGLSNPADRDNLIAYLAAASK